MERQGKVYQEIISRFVEMLRSGSLKAGDRLPAERLLAVEFGVSRSSVREALKVIETIGLIEIRGGGGAFVSNLNLAPFISIFAPLITRRKGFELELLDLRELLEVKAAGLIAENINLDMIESFETIINNMRSSIENNDTESGAILDIEFHKLIFSNSGNYVLSQAAEYVNSLMEISIKENRSFLLKERENAERLFSEHYDIYNAIKKGDSESAKNLMAEHINRVRGLYIKKFTSASVKNR